MDRFPTNEEALLYVSILLVPAVISHTVWRHTADVRADEHREGRHAALLVWAALYGFVTMALWPWLSTATEEASASGGFVSWSSLGYATLALLLGPYLLGLAAGHAWLHLVRYRWFSALGFLDARSRTPWDCLTVDRRRALYVWFDDHGVQFRGTMWRADTEGKQIWVDDILTKVDGEWTPVQGATGALIFRDPDRVLWFAEWHHAEDRALPDRDASEAPSFSLRSLLPCRRGTAAPEPPGESAASAAAADDPAASTLQRDELDDASG